jgi:hypothetical protein
VFVKAHDYSLERRNPGAARGGAGVPGLLRGRGGFS